MESGRVSDEEIGRRLREGVDYPPCPATPEILEAIAAQIAAGYLSGTAQLRGYSPGHSEEWVFTLARTPDE